MLVLPSRRWRSGCPSLLDGLVLGWPLDEPVTGNRRALQGNPAGVLTDVNTVGTADAPPGIGGLCVSMDGSTEYLYCNDPFPPPSGLSITTWVYPTSVAGVRIVVSQDRVNAGVDRAFGLYLSAGVVNGYLSANGTTATNVSVAGAISINTWTLVTLTWSGTSLVVYKNTTAGTPSAFTSALWNGAEPLRIGAYSSGGTPTSLFAGRLAQLLIWRRALTAAEIAYLYADGTGRPPSDWMPRAWVA